MGWAACRACSSKVARFARNRNGAIDPRSSSIDPQRDTHRRAAAASLLHDIAGQAFLRQACLLRCPIRAPASLVAMGCNSSKSKGASLSLALRRRAWPCAPGVPCLHHTCAGTVVVCSLCPPADVSRDREWREQRRTGAGQPAASAPRGIAGASAHASYVSCVRAFRAHP